MFLTLVLFGALLRAIALVAYRPALFAGDSSSYLSLSVHLHPSGLHPAGYPAFLKLVRALADDASLAVIPLVQHLLGLSAAVVLYAMQLRLGVRRGLAALAVAPVLLDAYWLNLEQYVMSETLTLALLVAACAALLWRRPLGLTALAVAALALAGATMTRTIVVLLMLPAAVAVVALADRGSRGRSLLVFAIAGMLPLAAYATWFHSVHGRYALAGQSERYLYGRVATFVDCSAFPVPSEERPLCPKEPVSRRWHPYYYIWLNESPYLRPPEHSRARLAGRFAQRAIVHQPLAYARTVAGDVIRGFAPTRRTTRPGEALWRWQFQRHHPLFTGTRQPPYMDAVLCGDEHPGAGAARRCATLRAKWTKRVRRFGDRDLTVHPRLAGWLTSYRRFAFVPGPLLAIALVVGAVGVIVAGRRRERHLWTACFLMTAVAAILIVAPIASLHFAWRYQILALVLVPVCGSLGLTALLRGSSGRTATPPPFDPSTRDRQEVGARPIEQKPFGAARRGEPGGGSDGSAAG